MASEEDQRTTSASGDSDEAPQSQGSQELSQEERTVESGPLANSGINHEVVDLALAWGIEPMSNNFVDTITRLCQFHSMGEPFPSLANLAACAFDRATRTSAHAGEEGVEEATPLSAAELDALLMHDRVDTALGLGVHPLRPSKQYGEKDGVLATVSTSKPVRMPKTCVGPALITRLALSNATPEGLPPSTDRQDLSTNAKQDSPKRKAADNGVPSGSNSGSAKRAREPTLKARLNAAVAATTATTLPVSNSMTPAAAASLPAQAPSTASPRRSSTTATSQATSPTLPSVEDARLRRATPTGPTSEAMAPGGTVPKDPRPNKCTYVDCEYHAKGFARKAQRDRHVASVHLRIVVAACPGCDRQFTRTDNFEAHKDVCAEYQAANPTAAPPSPAAAS